MKKMIARVMLAAAATVLVSSSVMAASQADLVTTLTPPSVIRVNEAARYRVKVENDGSRDAVAVQLTIQLPVTQTSPTVYIMGNLTAFTAPCTRVGTTLSCPLGTVRKRNSVTVTFDIALPYSTNVLAFTARARTDSSEQRTFNNDVAYTAVPQHYATPMVTGVTATNRHCTGNTWLSSFFECALFPSSITSHETVFNSNGTIGFVGVPATYTGTWTHTPSTRRLTFRYFDSGQIVAQFDGRGVSAKCFEGKTTFASNPDYVSMYQVCFP